jgi:hypothetical protein
MKQSSRGIAHTVPLKIRLPETLRQELPNATGKPFNHAIVEVLYNSMDATPVRVLSMHGDLCDVAVKTLTTQEWRLAQQYRELNATIRILLKAGTMLAPESTLLRPVRPGSADHLFLERACEKVRRALDIVLGLDLAMAGDSPIDAESETAAAPLVKQSGTTFLIFDELLGQSGWRRKESDPNNIVEVKIRLPKILREQLAAEASRNKRTLTAEIRGRLELSCTVEIFKRAIGQEMATILTAAAENVLSLRLSRMALTTDKLLPVIEALETAEALLNPLCRLLRRVRSGSSADRELKDARKQIRSALVAIQRLSEAVVEAHSPTNLTVPLGSG